MCGIAGFVGPTPHPQQVADAMASTLAHRGPDDSGTWLREGVALAHRRLAILDLSAAGHQPMVSACGRWVIAFNGEIYNHADIRVELDGAEAAQTWRGHSDTETLLAAIAHWGVAPTLRRATGMFAFALWDRRERSLILARDRLGEKPLYYGWQRDAFLFGSELKALAAHPAWRPEVDRGALTLFMRYGYVPEPHSIYRGICKLPPGCWFQLDAAAAPGLMPTPSAYWSAGAAATSGRANPVVNDAAALVELETLLERAVARQCIADVPLGAMLSGGIDSSIVIAVMQAHSNRPINTFTIGFHEAGFNEAEHAAAVSRHLGTDHTELYLSPEQVRAVIPRLPDMYDEPFGDSSQLPMHLVAALARKHVAVALSGDGGDELFAGYNRHFLGDRLWRRAAGIHPGVRRMMAGALTAPSPDAWDAMSRLLSLILPRRLKFSQPGDRIYKLAAVLDAASPDVLYNRLVSLQTSPAALVIDGSEPALWADAQTREAGLADITERMLLRDLLTYLPGDILTKVDRAAMAVSLETRVPLLDHALVEFAWRLPLNMKIRNGQGKWLLRQLLYKHVPQPLVDRPKQGFGIPLGVWLRGPLREWAEALLDEGRLAQEGYLHPGPVREKWREHLSGRRNWQYWLWNVLMFQAWRERWV